MARHTTNISKVIPAAATRITTFAAMTELLSRFAAGLIPLLVIVGTPGLCKSQAVQKAIKGRKCLYFKGRRSPIRLYCKVYHHQDQPLVIDDPISMMADRLCLEYLINLTETDDYKRLQWDTNTSILKQQNVPDYFWTASPVCLITNRWEHSPLFESLESRGELFYFDPNWAELYKQIGKWYWDQEIYDYLYDRLPVLRRPDARIVVKAANRKESRMRRLGWTHLIDNYVDDMPGLLVRKLLSQDFATNAARAAEFEQQGGGSERTFYYRLDQIRRWSDFAMPARITLKRTQRPQPARPKDGPLPSERADAD